MTERSPTGSLARRRRVAIQAPGLEVGGGLPPGLPVKAERGGPPLEPLEAVGERTSVSLLQPL